MTASRESIIVRLDMNESNSDKVDLSTLKIDRKRKSDAPSRGRKWLHLLWLLVPIIIYVGYRTTIKSITPATKVQIARAQLLSGTDAAAELVATGYVVAQIKAAVASKGSGRLEVLNVEEGDKVKAGEILAILDNSDIRADLDYAKAGLLAARADSVEASVNLKRQQGLIKADANSSTDAGRKCITSQREEIVGRRFSARSAVSKRMTFSLGSSRVFSRAFWAFSLASSIRSSKAIRELAWYGESESWCCSSRICSTFNTPPAGSACTTLRSGCCIRSIWVQFRQFPHGMPGATGCKQLMAMANCSARLRLPTPTGPVKR